MHRREIVSKKNKHTTRTPIRNSGVDLFEDQLCPLDIPKKEKVKECISPVILLEKATFVLVFPGVGLYTKGLKKILTAS